jgi:nucleotide-binding universal stress UspA family protein
MSVVETRNRLTTLRAPRANSSTAQLHHGPVHSNRASTQLDTIVVPLDGTDFAEHAIPFALAIARRSGAVLKLVRAFTPGDATTLHPGIDAFSIVECELRREASRYLDKVHRRIVARASEVTVIAHLAEAPSVIEAITRVSNTADLVVMATHGRGWLGRVIFGSVGRDLLKTRRRPTIFVRGYESPVDLTADPVPLHLAIGLDGRKSSERILEAAGVIAKVTDAKTTLLHVNDPHEFDERFAHSSPDGYLRWTGRAFATMGPEVSIHVVRDAVSPTKGILSFVNESDGDLIAVTSRSVRPSFRRTTENLIRNSRVPVLVVHE